MRSNGYITTPAVLALALALGGCGAAAPTGTATLDAEAVVTQAASNRVTISPLPGTADASPSTQISFLGGQGTRVAAVSVRGSQSGVHTGVLRAYSTGTGESFLPARPFVSGERVKVRATVATGSETLHESTSFTVASELAVSQREFPTNPGNQAEVQHYSSAPTLTPSSIHITTPASPGASPGYLFMAPYQGDGTPGPMITDQAGNLVWFHPIPAGDTATNFQVQSYEGKPVLTWWQGRVLEVGFGQGEDVIVNSAYRRLAGVRAGNGYRADLHEIRLTPEGTAWIDIFDPIRTDLAAVHGRADGVLSDSIVQEIDVKTGLVMWEWHALGHVPIGESKNPVPAQGTTYPWDYVHINSVDPGPSGDVLLSSRSTWTLYDVDIRTGAVRWRLGGSHSSFKLGPGTHFYWQHDAEFQPGGLISVFDNGSDPPKEKQSRGLLLRPDLATHTVALVRQFTNPHSTLLATSQGNLLSLPGGNWLMGYGGLPNFTEYDPAGRVLLDGTLGKNVQDFRTYLSPWSGQPETPPSLTASSSGAQITVSVSWNGATQVAEWRVLAGASPGSLTPVALAPKTGFQTTITAAGAARYVAVQALDATGAVIGTSATVTT
jgi:hypothetical protein